VTRDYNRRSRTSVTLLAAAPIATRFANVLSFAIYNEENGTQWWDTGASTCAQVLAPLPPQSG
jgi:hypothetical protein